MKFIRHPLLNAWWKEVRCRLDLHARIVAVGIVVALALLIYLSVRFAPSLLDGVNSHPVIVALLVAVESSVLAQLTRRRWEMAYSSNWLSTLPVSRPQRLGMIALHASVAPALVLTLLMFVALLVHAPVTLLAGLSLATVAGAVLGWFIPQSAGENSAAPVATIGRQRQAAMLTATLASLSGWSTAQARVWLRPRSISRLLLPVMLSLPMGTSGNLAIALMTLLMLLVYLCVLLLAMREVVRASEAWLRPTPIGLIRLAVALLTRPLLQQLQWTLLAMVLFVALGTTLLAAARLAEWWLAIVMLTSSIQLGHMRQGLPATSGLLLSFGALLMLDRLKQHLVLPCALLISAWQLRKVRAT
jgi:hypothetical protein